MTRILIGCPTWNGKKYCLPEYAAAIKALVQHAPADILIIDNSLGDAYLAELRAVGLPAEKGPWQPGARDRIVASRNILRQRVLDGGYDWLFSLEQDVMPAPDTLQRLLSHGRDIVTGVVRTPLPWNGNETDVRMLPMAYVPHPRDPAGLAYAPEAELARPQLLRIAAAGLGCALISRRALERIRFRWEGSAFDDMAFFNDARNAGFKSWCDTSVQPTHLHGSWEGIRK
jgi:hypothetical protein